MAKKIILLILFLGVALRIFLAIYFYGNYDQASWDIVAKIGREGGNVYAETTRYNYTPTWSIVVTVLSYIPVPLHASMRIFITIVDLFIAIFLYKLTNKPFLAAVYIGNPVTILLTGYHGQFENLAILPLLAAIFFMQRRKSLWVLFILCTLSILIKHITIFFVIALYYHFTGSWRKTILLLIATTAIFIASFIPYLPDGFENIVSQVFLYSSIPHPYGLIIFPYWNTALYIVSMIVIIFIIRHKNLVQQMILISLFLLILIPGISNQYLIIPVVFGTLSINWGYIIFTLVSTFFLLGSPDNLNLPLPSIWYTVWLALVIWAVIQIIKTVKSDKARAIKEDELINVVQP